jgi:hypothetical protein
MRLKPVAGNSQFLPPAASRYLPSAEAFPNLTILFTAGPMHRQPRAFAPRQNAGSMPLCALLAFALAAALHASGTRR